MYNLKNKVAVITGGAKGIGKEIVKEFLREGVKYLAIVDISETVGVALEKELKEKYGNKTVQFFNIDVTNDDCISELFHKIVEEFGAIDVIVNNAGVASDEINYFKKEIEINFTAVVALTLKGLDLMRKDKGGRGGTIINISSIAALAHLSPNIFVYAATKSAVLHFSNCIGMEEYFRYTNVRILTVCFGGTDTEIIQGFKGIDDITTEAQKEIIQKLVDRKICQTPLVAAQGVVQSFKNGNTGSTWLVDNSNITDITANIKQAYKIMSKNITI